MKYDNKFYMSLPNRVDKSHKVREDGCSSDVFGNDSFSVQDAIRISKETIIRALRSYTIDCDEDISIHRWLSTDSFEEKCYWSGWEPSWIRKIFRHTKMIPSDESRIKISKQIQSMLRKT